MDATLGVANFPLNAGMKSMRPSGKTMIPKSLPNLLHSSTMSATCFVMSFSLRLSLEASTLEKHTLDLVKSATSKVVLETELPMRRTR